MNQLCLIVRRIAQQAFINDGSISSSALHMCGESLDWLDNTRHYAAVVERLSRVTNNSCARYPRTSTSCTTPHVHPRDHSCTIIGQPSTGEIVNLLIQSGAEIKAQNNNNGCRLLHMAFEGLDPVILRTLITAGADLTAKTTDGEAPFHNVTANEMESDRNDCWSPNAAVHEMLRLIVEADPTVAYALNSRGETPLHIAAKNPSPLVVVFLLQRSADQNTKDHQGKTPPLLAVETPRWETDGELKNITWYWKDLAIMLLVSTGADVNYH